MMPLWMHRRDQVVLEHCQEGSLKNGDIVLYRRENGQYVLHRIIKLYDRQMSLCGDAQSKLEKNVSTNAVIARVVKICRKGKWFSCDHRGYLLYVYLWGIMRPVRGKVLGIAGRIISLKKMQEMRMNMNTVQTAVIQLLQIYMGMDECVDTFPKQVDWAEVYELAVKHNIGGILYTAIRKLPEQQGLQKDIQRELQVHFYASVSRSKEQDMRMVQVIEYLNQKKIFHVLMKGWVLKRYYPIPELRTMGDVDFLIREEDRQRTHEALLQLGFLCTSDKGFVWCYEKGNTLLEVHSRICFSKSRKRGRYGAVLFRCYFSYRKGSGRIHTVFY